MATTVYNGTEYRSKTEAQWAYFFTQLGIDFVYEHASYQITPSETYTPDFYLPNFPSTDVGVFIEVKNQGHALPTDDECFRAYQLSQLTNRKVYIFCGEVSESQHTLGFSAHAFLPCFDDEQNAVLIEYETEHWWFRCPNCGKLDITKKALSSTKTVCDHTYIDSTVDFCSLGDHVLNRIFRDASNQKFKKVTFA